MFHRIHHFATVEVDEAAAGAEHVLASLDHFRTNKEPREPSADIRLGSTAPALVGGSKGPGFSIAENGFEVDKLKLACRHDEGQIICGGRTSMAPVLLPLLDWRTTLFRGATFVHAAALEVAGATWLVTGWGGIGKSATVARAHQLGVADFLADDMVLLAEDRRAYAFPKPMYIYSYHRPLFPALFGELHKPVIPSQLARPFELVRQSVRPLIKPFPRVETAARKLTPEHMRVAPADALPGLVIRDSSPIRGVVSVRRTSASDRVVRPSNVDTATRRMTLEFVGEVQADVGFDFLLAASHSGLAPMDEWLSSRRAAIRSATAGATFLDLDLPRELGAVDAADAILDVIGSAK